MAYPRRTASCKRPLAGSAEAHAPRHLLRRAAGRWLPIGGFENMKQKKTAAGKNNLLQRAKKCYSPETAPSVWSFSTNGNEPRRESPPRESCCPLSTKPIIAIGPPQAGIRRGLGGDGERG